MMRDGVRALMLALPVLLLAGCHIVTFDDSARYTENFHYSYPLAAGGRLAMENLNGSIEISGWEKDSVEIDGAKYAPSQERLKDIQVRVTNTPNLVRIETQLPSLRSGNMGARYVIRVPHSVTLDRIVSSNGSIRVEDTDGEVHLRTSNGSVRVIRVQGLVDAETTNGSMEASNVTGDTRLHSSNGSIHADVSKGSFEATTSNGSITARLTAPDPVAPIKLSSSNGTIDLTLDAAREVRATTSNSSITVHLPANLSARLSARTSNSNITSDFDVTVHGGTMSKHELDGTVGMGGPLIDLATSNGSIKILKQ